MWRHSISIRTHCCVDAACAGPPQRLARAGQCRGFNFVAIGAGIIRIVPGLIDFIAQNLRERAELQVEPISQRSMKIHVSILEAEVTVARDSRSVVSNGIRPEQQGGIVAGTPIALSNRLADSERDEVQVEAKI